jgi:hypothetical protein
VKSMASKAPLLCSRRAVLTAIAGTIGLSAVPVARSAEPQLAADEGIVLYGLTSEFPRVVTRADFRQLHSSIMFTGWPQSAQAPPIPTVVKAGFYYFYYFDTDITFFQMFHGPFQEPASTHGAFQVQSGAVTYAGDWYVGITGVKWSISIDTIVRARKDNPWLEHYPLHVAVAGRDVVRLPWEQVPQA